jgi:hypothetical protein
VNTFSKLSFAAAALSAAVAVSAPAHAVTFANFTQTGTTRTIHWVRDANTGAASLNGHLFTGPTATSHAPVSIRFNFQLPELSSFSNLAATLQVNAVEVGHAATFTGAPDNVVTQTFVDGNVAGSPAASGFAIIYTGPTVVLNGHTVAAGANLLSAHFTNIWIQGVRLANAGAGSDSDPTPGTISFTSDFLNFGNTVGRGLSWDLTSISPVLGFQSGHAIPSFNASLAGAFSAEFVPEPMAWALMISGFGLAGVALRRRRALATA